MENEETVVVPETTEEVTPEVTTEETQEEEVDWKSEAEKAKELANNYKVRAEKAEKKAKEVPEAKNTEGYSLKDTIALSKVNVDDIDDIVEAAKVLKIPLHQAVNNKVVKALLADKEEVRTSANVANTGTVRRGSVKPSDESLLANANSGKLPESDEEITRLFQARAKQK
jgi:hypothetical protein